MIKFLKIYIPVFSFFVCIAGYSSDFEEDVQKTCSKRKSSTEDNNFNRKHRKTIKEEDIKEKIEGEKKATEEEIELQTGKGTKETGGGPGGYYWKILYNNIMAGKVYINFIDEPPLGKHASLQIYLNKHSQGKGIGRIAYARACELSPYDDVYAYMSKKNKASFKAASAAGFVQLLSCATRQIIMHWNRKKKGAP